MNISHSDNGRHLKRTVWLSEDDRDSLREAIRVASQKIDTFKYGVSFDGLLKELDKADGKRRRGRRNSHLLTLIVSEMRLPDDWMPITITSEEIKCLTIWGNLPERVMLKTIPSPKIFYTEEHPLFYYEDIPDAERVLLSKKRYDNLRKKYRVRMRFSL